MINKDSLSRDKLFHDRTEEMTPLQKREYEIMQCINHFVNLATEGHRVLSTGACEVMLYSEFLLALSNGFEKTQKNRERCLSEEEIGKGCTLAVYDEFIRIAKYANNAIKNILRNPSRQIKKVEVKQQASRVAGFTSKTMRWMSTRSGRNIAEKIAPENKILTTKTVFSVDTKENRALMYLYKNLAQIVASRFSKTKCFDCNERSFCEQEWLDDMKKMLAAFSRLKMEELGEVKAEKQAMQNNKLMYDLNYKIIWDATVMLTRVEEDIKEQFDKVRRRFTKLMYWLMIGACLQCKNAKLFDRAGAISDKNGILSFQTGDVSDDIETDLDKIAVVSETNDLLREYTFYRSGTLIKIDCLFADGAKGQPFELDTDIYFNDLTAWCAAKEKSCE